VHHSHQQKRTSRSSSQLDYDHLVRLNEIPVEEVELMPISSGFGYYPYNYPTTITDRVPGVGPESPGAKVKLDFHFVLALGRADSLVAGH
jgi:hypothetical protein